jgi:hypothetical protein
VLYKQRYYTSWLHSERTGRFLECVLSQTKGLLQEQYLQVHTTYGDLNYK